MGHYNPELLVNPQTTQFATLEELQHQRDQMCQEVVLEQRDSSRNNQMNEYEYTHGSKAVS